VLRFLGKRPRVEQFHKAEILSHLGARAEGVRVKHALDRNSVKMYDKQQSVLRVETTINNTRQMKAFRASENNPDGLQSWQKLRKGVADLARRAEISQKSNERYLDALSATEYSSETSRTDLGTSFWRTFAKPKGSPASSGVTERCWAECPRSNRQRFWEHSMTSSADLSPRSDRNLIAELHVCPTSSKPSKAIAGTYAHPGVLRKPCVARGSFPIPTTFFRPS